MSGEVRSNCPFCGDTKLHLYANPRKGVYFCHRCGARGFLRDLGFPEVPALPPPEVGRPCAPPEKLDRVYRELLSNLGLSGIHLEHLTSPKRGFSREDVAALGYRTLPRGGRLALAGAVASSCDPSGVPGFYLRGGSWCLAGPPGILIPVRGWRGEIRGFQVRCDDPSRGKYAWLSSAGRPGGTGARSLCHVSLPPGASLRRVWLTEGPLKADISSSRLKEPVVAVPGVSSWRAVLDEDLPSRGVEEAVVAFDAEENPLVRSFARELSSALSSLGLRVFVASWDPSLGKGIDDLLLSGGVPVLSRFDFEEVSCVNVFTLSGVCKSFETMTVERSDGTAGKKVRLLISQKRNGSEFLVPVVAWDSAAESLLKQSPLEGRYLLVQGAVRSFRRSTQKGGDFWAVELVAREVDVLDGDEKEGDLPF